MVVCALFVSLLMIMFGHVLRVRNLFSPANSDDL